jgi:hypothetical protein
MAQWILKANGNVVPRRSHRPLKTEELHSEVERKKQDVYDQLIERRWGTAISGPSKKPAVDNTFEAYQDDEEEPRRAPDIEDSVDNSGKVLNQSPAYDRMLNAEISLQMEHGQTKGIVKRRAVGPDGKVSGRYDENPYLNSLVYEVEFTDGLVKEYSANVIAENMLTQVDSDGYSLTMMKGIVDYKRDDAVAVPKSEQYIVTK